MSTSNALETQVGLDGALTVSAEDMQRAGVHPGDRVRIEPITPRRIKSMLGYGARDVGSTNDHLRETRSEMGESFGDDLTS